MTNNAGKRYGLASTTNQQEPRKLAGNENVLTAAHDLQCYHAAMRRVPIPLLMLIIVIAFPVAIPIAIVSWVWDRRRMQAVAERTCCEGCGMTLGIASLRRADAEWVKRAAALHSTRAVMRIRMIRSLWAICAACDAEYDYDFRARAFSRAATPGGHTPRARAGSAGLLE